MAKKIGICRNIDCDNYKKTIEVEPGGEFECPLCHQPLQEAEGGRKRKVKDEDGGGDKNRGGLLELLWSWQLWLVGAIISWEIILKTKSMFR